jgi:glyceraldehyde-3-phosphate dehydrogenase/erythrose-4-phosphate dehydrogenase
MEDAFSSGRRVKEGVELSKLTRLSDYRLIHEEETNVSVRVAINGFGRIGRLFFRAALSNPDLGIVAINGVRDNAMSAHLLKYDSLYGRLAQEVTATESGIAVDGREIRTFNIRDSFAFPWDEVGAEVVLESTGKLRERGQGRASLEVRCQEGSHLSPCQG